MTHVRAQIRAEAATLITGLTTTGSNVFTTRRLTLDPSELPGWVVSTDGDEDVETDGMGGQQSRECGLIFTGCARSTSGDELDDILDTMAEELETVVTPHAISSASIVLLDGTSFEWDVDDTEQVYGTVVVAYRALYYTQQGAPGTAL